MGLAPALACASGEGWARTDARVCATAAPARLCVRADPDRSVVVRLGTLALVPGECADAPRERGGRVARLELTHGDGRTTHRTVRLPGGRVTTLVVDEDAKVRARRESCTTTPAIER